MSKGLTEIRDYARQRLAGHTRLSRQEYITAVVEEGRRVGASEGLAAQTARYAWDSRWGRIDPNANADAKPDIGGDKIAAENYLLSRQAEPEFDLAPIPMPPPVEGRQDTYSLQDLLRNADKADPLPPLPAVNQVTYKQQVRYDVALMAKNKNVDAMRDMQPEAAARGMTVEALADMIIDERRADERRAFQNGDDA